MRKLIFLFFVLISFASYGQLELPYGIKVLDTVPVDSRYDSLGTPYTNTAGALLGVPIGIRYPGLTLNVAGVEYWWPPSGGVTNGELVIKTSGGSGDVTGPASAVSGNFPSFNGTGGKTLQDSGFGSSSFWSTSGNSSLTSDVIVDRTVGTEYAELAVGIDYSVFRQGDLSGDASAFNLSNIIAQAASSYEASLWNLGTNQYIGLTPSGLYLRLNSDATGDMFYKSDANYVSRLAKGAEGTILRAGASVPAYSTFTIPNTISALSAFVSNSANTLTEITPTAGQSIRINAGGTAWEAYTPGSGGGDVTKVGTPVDNQVGVWTGDGTIEGTTGLTYDGTALNITGNITLSGTVDGIDIATDVAANTAKVSNATHTGDVTGSTALTIGADKVLESHLKAVNAPTDEYVLTYESTTGDFEWQAAGAGTVTSSGSPASGYLASFTSGTDITGTSTYTTAVLDELIARTTLTTTTGTVVGYTTWTWYGTPASPETGNITESLTSARAGLIQRMYHNNGTEPTYPAGWVQVGSGTYQTSTLNIIHFMWISGTRVEYWITQ